MPSSRRREPRLAPLHRRYRLRKLCHLHQRYLLHHLYQRQLLPLFLRLPKRRLRHPRHQRLSCRVKPFPPNPVRRLQHLRRNPSVEAVIETVTAIEIRESGIATAVAARNPRSLRLRTSRTNPVPMPVPNPVLMPGPKSVPMSGPTAPASRRCPANLSQGTHDVPSQTQKSKTRTQHSVLQRRSHLRSRKWRLHPNRSLLRVSRRPARPVRTRLQARASPIVPTTINWRIDRHAGPDAAAPVAARAARRPASPKITAGTVILRKQAR